LPAVHANGRPRIGSFTPGAWPMLITRETIAPPLTAGRCIFGQSVQARSAAT
jgi:hypothetical protein